MSDGTDAGDAAEPGPVTVRVFVAADAEALGRLHLDCWRDAYADLVDPDRLAPYLADVESRVTRWREILDGPARLRLAEDDGVMVGFASVLPTTADGTPHLAALYTLRPYWGTGLGQRLLDEILGVEAATLSVFRDNVRARRFYARNGFVPDGSEQEEPHFGGVEIGMVRPAPA